MGWLDDIKKKKEGKIPDIFKDKNEDDILKMLEDASKDKEQVTTLTTKLAEQETTVANINSEFTKVKERLAAAEANRSQNQNQNQNQNQEPPNFVEDPDAAFASRNGPTLAIAVQSSMMTSRLLAQQQLDNADMASGGKTMDGRLFRAWASEIDAKSKTFPAVQLTSPEAWLNIYLHTKGQHADELRDPEVRKKKYNFLEPTVQSTPASKSEPDNRPAEQQLTDKELHVAEKMHVTPEAYLKRKQAMQFANV